MRERILLTAPSSGARPTPTGGTPFVPGEQYALWAHARDASGRETEQQDTDIAEHDVVFRIDATPLMLGVTPGWRLSARGHNAWNIVRVNRAAARGGVGLARLLIYAKQRTGQR